MNSDSRKTAWACCRRKNRIPFDFNSLISAKDYRWDISLPNDSQPPSDAIKYTKTWLRDSNAPNSPPLTSRWQPNSSLHQSLSRLRCRRVLAGNSRITRRNVGREHITRDVYDITMTYANLRQVSFCWVTTYLNYHYLVSKLTKPCEKFSSSLNLNVHVHKFLYVNDKILFCLHLYSHELQLLCWLQEN